MSAPRHIRTLTTTLLRVRPSPYPSTSYTPSSSSHATTTRFPTSSIRSSSFHTTTTTPYASEAPNNWKNQWAQDEVPLFERLQEHPEVLEAIERLAQIVKEKTGVDLQSGAAPTMSMMAQLARDPDLRSAAESLMASLRSAGIEVDPRNAFKALQMMGGAGFEGTTGLEDLHEAARRSDEEKDGKKGGKGEGEK